MGNRVQDEMNKIEIPAELHERSKRGVLQAKSEMRRSRPVIKRVGALAASVLILAGSYGLYQSFFQNKVEEAGQDQGNQIVQTEEGVYIPEIKLPEGGGASMDMIGLIVYKGGIYIQTDTRVVPEHAKALVGEKLGKTKGSIDEWSSQDEYAVEFASSIGEIDVFKVKGYDSDFRIMAYDDRNGEPYAEFFERLHGITVQSGADIFGKVQLVGNVVDAKYRTFSEWDNSIDNYHPIESKDIVETFVEELNSTVPYTYEHVEETLGDFRNNEEYREVSLTLKDGTVVSLALIKEGYIRYGFLGVYFKMDDDVFREMWNEIE
ncbi:hypothetical protein GCM10008967_38180 [Bacillus carboniphilus]|uniref:Uncharacterized protein n=1 Tax=Bacillus carboniphilus TaxID=86663 RepID=A0ABP3GG46_9BACI